MILRREGRWFYTLGPEVYTKPPGGGLMGSMTNPSTEPMKATQPLPAVYEYGVRSRDGSTQAGFNTAAQAQAWADSQGLTEGTYSVDRRPVGYWGVDSPLDQLKLFTVDDVAARLGHISPARITRLAKAGQVEWVQGTRNAVLMTEAQIAALLRYLTQPARPPVEVVDLPRGVASLTTPRQVGKGRAAPSSGAGRPG